MAPLAPLGYVPDHKYGNWAKRDNIESFCFQLRVSNTFDSYGHLCVVPKSQAYLQSFFLVILDKQNFLDEQVILVVDTWEELSHSSMLS